MNAILMMPLAPGQAVKLLEGNWLYDATVTGLQAGFCSIKLNHPSRPCDLQTRLVPRDRVFAVPEERVRLEKVLQESINDLSLMLDSLRLQKDEEVELVIDND